MYGRWEREHEIGSGGGISAGSADPGIPAHLDRKAPEIRQSSDAGRFDRRACCTAVQDGDDVRQQTEISFLHSDQQASAQEGTSVDGHRHQELSASVAAR